MPPTCTTCRHREREAIDRELLAGTPLRNIAQRHGLDHVAIHRHRAAGHVAAPALARMEEGRAAMVGRLVEYVGELERAARSIRERAEASDNQRIQLGALAASRAHVELMVKLIAAAEGADPEDRVRDEARREARRLVDATLGSVEELEDEGRLDPEVALELRQRVAGRLDATGRGGAG